MIDLLAQLVSPIFLPMGVSYADLVFYLETLFPWLLGLLAAFIVMLLVLLLARKFKKGWRGFAALQSVALFLLVAVLIVNAVCYGPMKSTLSSFLNASKVELADDVVAQSLETIQRIGEEGFVLLKNDGGALPLKDSVKKLNVFGWASTKPYIGGTGSSASSAAAATDILTSLKNAGYETNQALTDMYVAYAADRPVADMFGQNLTLPEPTAAAYTDELMADAKAFSDTALIVIARGGGENYDLPTDMHAVIHGTYNIVDQVSISPNTYPYTKVTYQNNGDYDDFDEGEHYLQLSNTEEAMIEKVCANFSNVVVVINACNPMELSWVDEYDEIGAVILAPAPGVQGFAALGSILNGDVNPSGRTADTFVRDLLDTPTINNVGVHSYTNVDSLKEKILKKDSTYQGALAFVNYNEGIYVGYKFYETAAEEGLIDYAAVVQYPFGYGLSYTTFEKTIEGFKDEGDTVSFTVSVKNTGDVAGRDVAEIYYTAPYVNGGIEKASVNLIDFAKTGVIEPGRTEKIYFTLSKEDMASYDATGVKVAGGGYILEAGEYVVSVRDNSHDVCDSATFTVAADTVYAQGRSSDETAAVNQFEDYTRGAFVELSRKDGFANYAEAVAAPDAASYEMNKATEKLVAAQTVSKYDGEDQDDPDVVEPLTGEDNGLTLDMMAGLDYDDPQWDKLLDQLSKKEMVSMVNEGGWKTIEMESVGKMATSDCDGPAGLNNFLTGSYGTTYPAEVLMAQTWSKDVAYEIGISMGSEFAAANNYGWYGPAMNLHRSAFAGRNFEYYSEDGVLSGIIATQQVNGAGQFGVYAYIKHFALNDQELNRTAILLTWAGEQTIRENYLRPFEMAVKGNEHKAQAVMSSYNWFGAVPAYANSDLLNDVLRGEWGFEGMVITDYDGSYGYMISDNAIRNGGDLMLGYGNYDTNELDRKNDNVVAAMRRACKNILYTVANSGYYATEEVVETENKMDALFQQGNTIAAIALGALEALALLTLLVNLIKVRKAKKAAA